MEVAPTKREALVPAEPIAPPMTIESMLPVEIDEEALKVYRDHKEQVIEAVQVKMLERLSPGLIDRFMGKRGLTDYKLLDEILRLERGQATSNVNVAYFDGNIALVKKEIERLEAERQKLLGDSNAIRDQESPGDGRYTVPAGRRANIR